MVCLSVISQPQHLGLGPSGLSSHEKLYNYNYCVLIIIVPNMTTKTRARLVRAVIIIIIIIIIIISSSSSIISFMQGIYTYIPERNCVPREYSVAAILLLLFMVLISLGPVLNLLCFYISTSRSMCAVPNMAVFCSSVTPCFPGMLLTYFQMTLK